MNDAVLTARPVAADDAPVLRTLGLTKVFRQGDADIEVFADVNLTVPRGRRLAIVGAAHLAASSVTAPLATSSAWISLSTGSRSQSGLRFALK